MTTLFLLVFTCLTLKPQPRGIETQICDQKLYTDPTPFCQALLEHNKTNPGQARGFEIDIDVQHPGNSYFSPIQNNEVGCVDVPASAEHWVVVSK